MNNIQEISQSNTAFLNTLPQWISRRLTLKNLEMGGLVFLLICMSNGIFNSNFINIPISLFYLLGVGFGFLVIWRYLPQLVGMLIREWSTTIMISFVGLSIFWSIAPRVSLEPIIWFYLTTFVGLYIALRFSLKEQLWIVIAFGTLSLFISFFFIFVMSDVGVHASQPHQGLWRGIYAHKNILSRYLSVTLVLLVALGKQLGYWRWILAGVIVFGIWGTGSGTGIITSIIMLLAIPILQILWTRHQLTVSILLMLLPIGLIILLLLSVNYSLILEFFGEDVTLTGRTDLWSAALQMIEDRPWFGWGFRASFSEKSPIFALIRWQDAPFAHNHWLDLTLELGIFATIAYASGLFLSLGRSVIYIRRQRTIESFFPLIFLIHINIIVLSIQSLPTTFDIFWIMYVAVVYSLAIQDVDTQYLPRFREKRDITKIAL